MTGPKTNEGELLLDDTQVSTKATAKYLKGSASKARAVLDLIRGLDVRRADEVLRFSDRGAAADVRKVLASAVANAVHNFEQDVEELFVVACYADEGPTLKRFRPRARGSASRIRKRSCHVTVVVARMSDARLEVVQARQAAATAGGRRAAGSAQARRDRVARSRARAEALRTGGVAAAVEHLEESEAEAEILEVLEGDDPRAADAAEAEDAEVTQEPPEAELDDAEADVPTEPADGAEDVTASAPDRSDDEGATGEGSAGSAGRQRSEPLPASDEPESDDEEAAPSATADQLDDAAADEEEDQK